MNKEIAEEWVAALRSGEFEQGVSMLQSVDGGFCCLGVLTELISRKGLVKVPYHDSGRLIGSYLSGTVVSVCGMKGPGLANAYYDDIYVHDYKMRIRITHLNDGGFSFEQIADVIEYFWEEL